MSGYRSVVVTGAGAGIGRAIVRRLDADGYRVIGIEQNAASAQTAERELSSSGRIIPGDVTDRLVLQQARALGERGGEFVGWVNNAAVAIGGLAFERFMFEPTERRTVRRWGLLYNQ
jgi:NAD(P)-dependent dehydrogenase (short-subunit alcohol dehydrogenase family)